MGPKERTIRKKGSYDWPQSDQHCQQPALLKRAVSAHSADNLAAVAAALNARPRKTLGWRTPAEAFDQVLRSVQAGVATTG